MKSTILLSIIIIMEFLVFSNNVYSQSQLNTDLSKNYAPQNVTILDLDKDIEIQKVPVKVFYDGKLSKLQGPSNNISKVPQIDFIMNIAEGSDSSLYVIENKIKGIVQINKNGNIIKLLGKQGKGNGEFVQPSDILTSSHNYIYIPDIRQMNLQVFNEYGNYVKTINDLIIGKGNFAIGKNKEIFTLPREAMACPLPYVEPDSLEKNQKLVMHKKPDKYLIIMHDSTGKELKKIGVAKGDDPNIIRKNVWQRYYILTNEKSNYIWCVFNYLPILRKYDFDGNFIEEIRIKNNVIDTLINKKKYNAEKIKKLLSEDKNLAEKFKNLNLNSSPESIVESNNEIIIRDAKILPNNDIILNIAHYGNIQLFGNEKITKVVKKYKLTGMSKEIDFNQDIFNLSMINGRIYGYFGSTILRESR